MMARICMSLYSSKFPKAKRVSNLLGSNGFSVFQSSHSCTDLSPSFYSSNNTFSNIRYISGSESEEKNNGLCNVSFTFSKQFVQSSPVWATIGTVVQNHQVKGTIPYYKSICLSSFGSNKNIHVCRTFSSRATDKLDGLSAEVSTASNVNEPTTGTSDLVGGDWMDVAKSASKSVKDAVMYTGTKAKETLDEHMPVLQHWMDSSPYLKDTLIPASWTMLASILAWLVMPKVFRRIHRYVEQSSMALSLGRPSKEQVIYEKSIWGALEDPVRYLITFMAFSQLGLIIAPSTVAAQYMPQIWRGAAVLSLVWFLQRWKSNVFSRFSAADQIAGLDKEKFLALDKLSSVGLFVLGGMALAEVCVYL